MEKERGEWRERATEERESGGGERDRGEGRERATEERKSGGRERDREGRGVEGEGVEWRGRGRPRGERVEWRGRESGGSKGRERQCAAYCLLLAYC